LLTISKFLAEVFVRDPKLYRLGMFMFILGVLLFVPLLLDNRLIQGVNPWFKPIKFCISVGIYAFTVAWFLDYIKTKRGIVKLISVSTAVAMLIEILIVVSQAMRGEMSHFNFSTVLNQLLFGMMGAMIAISTLMIIVYFFTLLTVKSSIDGPYKMSVLMGVFIFLLASGVGGIMISNNAHSVGGPDGGAGIFFLNWSLTSGDLRIAHFMGLHALQILPLSCYFLLKNQAKIQTVYIVMILISVLYFLLFGALFLQAQAGNPLFNH